MQRIGDYELNERIGGGGMGEVWLGENVHTRLTYAIKLLLPEETSDSHFIARFFEEGRVMAQFDHPRIVRVHHVGHDKESGRYYLVMDYVAGPGGRPRSLREELAGRAEGRLPVAQVRKLSVQIAEGLAYAHERGIVHRDIKPANILIDSGGNARIADFGLVKAVGQEVVTSRSPERGEGPIHGTLSDMPTISPGAHEPRDVEVSLGDQETIVRGDTGSSRRSDAEGVLGTYDYMSPEQRGELPGVPMGPAGDVYAFGVMLYRILTGRRPTGRVERASRLVPGLAKSWDRIIDRCLEHQPQDRYANGRALLAAVRGVARPTGALVHLVRAIGFLCMLALVITAGYFGWTRYYVHGSSRPTADPVAQQEPPEAIPIPQEPDGKPGPGNTAGAPPPQDQTKPASDIALPGQIKIEGRAEVAVYEAGRQLGRAGQWIELAPGRHELELRCAGFRSQRLTVTVPPNEKVIQQSPSLIAMSGSIRIAALSTVASDYYLSRQKAQLQIDEGPWREVTLPHLEEGLSCADHKVALRVPGYGQMQLRRAAVSDDRISPIEFTLTPDHGTVTITSNVADAQVFDVAGSSLGRAGESLRLSPFVEHRLSVWAPRYRPGETTVRIDQPGADAGTRQVILQEQSMPEDLIEVKNASFASLLGLAPGSREGQDRQRQAVAKLGLPLEVRTRKAGIVLRLIPAGKFTMGSPPAEDDRSADEMQHEVTVAQPFYCGKFEVTQARWEYVMGQNPSQFRPGFVLEKGGLFKKQERFDEDTSEHPVDNVSWEACQVFLRNLCEVEGVPEGTYRLLTEAQWEYACRAGTGTAAYCTGTMSSLVDHAWYRENSDSHTHPVGEKGPNAFGLHDMYGNVTEWCEDWYGEYPAGAATASPNPVSGDRRVYRGACWISPQWNCRSAGRKGLAPNAAYNTLGLRIARSIAPYSWSSGVK